MNFIYLYVFLISYLFMKFNNRIKINLNKINRLYNKINYKLTIITTIYDFSYINIILFCIYVFYTKVIYCIFMYKLFCMVHLIYKNINKKNIIYNITDFMILSTIIFVSQFSIIYHIASILLIYTNIEII
jgi:hypothetical protein